VRDVSAFEREQFDFCAKVEFMLEVQCGSVSEINRDRTEILVIREPESLDRFSGDLFEFDDPVTVGHKGPALYGQSGAGAKAPD